VDVLGVCAGTAPAREHLVGVYGEPGTPRFKIMVRDQAWKYIYIANGDREQLFDVLDDPQELHNRATHQPGVRRRLRGVAVAACRSPGIAGALEGGDLRAFPYCQLPRRRIYQFDRSRGVTGFPARPQDVLH
jgi:choline-sulfatase